MGYIVKLLSAAVMVGTAAGCATPDVPGSEPATLEVSRQAVEAMRANDSQAFSALVMPELRPTLQLGAGPGVGAADLAKLAHCHDQLVTYSDPQMPNPNGTPGPHFVIVAFDQPCLVGFTALPVGSVVQPPPTFPPDRQPGTLEPQDKFVIALEQQDGRWYVQAVQWPVTLRRSPPLGP